MTNWLFETDKLCCKFRLATILSLSLLFAGSVQAADAFYHIRLQDRQGEYRDLGSMQLSDGIEGQNYRIDWDDSRFDDHFLSMRPFKCLPHPVQLICHLPYPYEIHRVIREGDLADLEYDMLFLHKSPQEYGISAWNGLYFKFKRTDSGFEGELRETDLNVLQAPPEKGDLRPINPDDLYEASDKHWPQRILIEKTSGKGKGS